MAGQSSDAAHACQVQVIAANIATLESLSAYLADAGIAAHGSQSLALEARDQVSAIVVFPDDFAEDEVVAHLRQARSARPDLVLVAVTSTVRQFELLTARDGSPLNLIVLPRPAFGWTILESLRCRATATSEDPA